MVLKRVGLFFGSFNPIHQGHMMIANYLRQLASLDEVWFMLSPQNPLKNKGSLLDEYERLHLLHLAIDQNPYLRVSDFEFYLPRPSYTIDTLTHLKEKHPEISFCLIMGEDNLRTLHLWKNYKEILNHYSILVYARHTRENGLEDIIQHPCVQYFELPLLPISSTFIRENIKKGYSMQYFLPEKVFHYIEEMRLYK
jgi:nicotinate-nucleotide adenylyltransferase